MSRSLAGLAVFWALMLGFTGVSCGPQSGENSSWQRRPVISVPPVPTRPFEDGYGAGFKLGERESVPHGKIPPEEDVARLAREQASDHPERTAPWERGFVEGYIEANRNVVTGKK